MKEELERVSTELPINDNDLRIALKNPRKATKSVIKHSKFRNSAYAELENNYKKAKDEIRKKMFIARTALNFSREDIERLVNITEPGLKKIEEGRSNIKLESLYTFAYALKINPKMFWVTINDLNDFKIKKTPLFVFSQKEKKNLEGLFRSDFNKTKVKDSIKSCDRAIEKLILDSSFSKYSWAAIVGAILGLYISKTVEVKYFFAGADLSVKLYKEFLSD